MVRPIVAFLTVNVLNLYIKLIELDCVVEYRADESHDYRRQLRY